MFTEIIREHVSVWLPHVTHLQPDLILPNLVGSQHIREIAID
jgi:hypothetical protein